MNKRIAAALVAFETAVALAAEERTLQPRADEAKRLLVLAINAAVAKKKI